MVVLEFRRGRAVVLEFSINPCGCDTDTDSPARWSWAAVSRGHCLAARWSWAASSVPAWSWAPVIVGMLIRVFASSALVGDTPYSP